MTDQSEVKLLEHKPFDYHKNVLPETVSKGWLHQMVTEFGHRMEANVIESIKNGTFGLGEAADKEAATMALLWCLRPSRGLSHVNSNPA